MSEISLYRKYRPHNFENLVGQDHVKDTLINALKSDHVAHAYLFTGPRGTGKTSTARLIAKALNCENLKDAFEPCNECDLCTDISDGRLIDLIEVDAASNRGIDEVRDLKEKINFAPSRAKYKIYIIDEVHMMTKEAFNALLKTLEEPPAHAYFILATTEVHKIPETIISRCQRFDFRRIDVATMKERLSFITKAEKIDAEDSALEAISKHADGGLRDAIGLVEQLSNEGSLKFAHVKELLGVSDFNLINKLFLTLRAKDSSGALAIVNELHNHGSDLRQFVHDFVELLRNRMIESVHAGIKDETANLIWMIDIFNEAQREFNLSIPQLPIEIAVIKITGGVGNKDEAKPAEMTQAAVATSQQAVATVKAAVSEPVKVEVAEKVAEAASAVEPKITEPAKSAEAPKNTESAKSAAAPAVDPNAALDRAHKGIVEQTASISAKNSVIDLATVKLKWPRITERITKPSLRMSLKNGHPIKVDGYDLTLEFSTNFHKDKVIENDNRVELETILDEALGHSMKIVTIVKEIEIMPVMDNYQQDSALSGPSFVEPAPYSPDSSQNSKPEEALNKVIDEALDIFGGELMD